MQKVFSYVHKFENTTSWNSYVCRDAAGKYYHKSSLGKLATKAFLHENSEWNSGDESVLFESPKKAFKYFLKFNKYWSDPRNQLIHLTNDLSLLHSNLNRWDYIYKSVLVDKAASNHAGFQLDFGIIFTVLKEPTLMGGPDVLRKITKKQFEKIIEKIDIPKVYDAYLDIYFQLDDLEFWEFVEDEFTIGLIRYPEHQKLELMVVIPSN